MKNRPNVLFILADDLGWGDVGYHGSPIRTPNIDRLARRGVELERHYVCPVCTPTRTALMSGRQPGRFGAHATAPTNSPVLPDNYYTLATLFRNAGYATGLFGKWHLGSDPRFAPNHYGFDVSYGSMAGGIDSYSHVYKAGPFINSWHRNGTRLDETGHVTDLVTDAAIEWIEAQTRRPFFCYLPFTAVHTPILPPEAWLDRYEGMRVFDDPEKNEAFLRYAAYTSHMDHAVGRMIETLKRLCIQDETIVIFASDNGAVTYEIPCDRMQYPGYRDDMHPVGCNEPLRGRKYTLYEGAMRTPAAFAWPGTVSPGTVSCPMHIADWLPTFAAMLNTGVPGGDDLDGVNMWPTLSGATTDAPARRIFWNLHHCQFAIREDGWKLIHVEAEGAPPPELYRIDDDPYEENNLADSNPDVVKRLTAAIHEEHAKDDTFKRGDV